MRLLSFISLSGLCVTSPTPPSSPDPEATSNTHTSRPLANYSSISPKPINPTSPTSPRGYTPPTPLKVCHDPNLGGSCFLYRLSAGCAGNPFNVDAIKSYELETGFLCEFYPYLDCRHDRGPPIIVNSKNAWIRANEVTYQIWSVYCHRASYVGSRRRSGRPGDTTVCGGPNFGACRENENALDGCVSFSAGVESLMQFKGWCVSGIRFMGA
ncbi:hypothetical protein GQ44DRAFT_757827 [Phaeosphaeriaceae sp. PMI808]|nr:hypothetical protein GQ44DRAFT_757827 [Phaeosphaeriaceae sp. PMI808]